MMEYRAELVLWVLSGTFPLIFMGLWAQAAQSGHFSSCPQGTDTVLSVGFSSSPIYCSLGDLGI
jgi:ABC-type uncharacterized transport system permease subunit